MSDGDEIGDWVWLMAAIIMTIIVTSIGVMVFQDIDRKMQFVTACHKQGGEAVFRFTEQNRPMCIKQEALKLRYDVTI